MNFHKQIENIVIQAGISIKDAKTFIGAIKKVRASRKDHYFTFHRDGKEILVKSLEQKHSGSAADKIAMFFLNLQDTPYDVVFVVADTTTQNMFKPLIQFFKNRSMHLDNVKVMSIIDFEIFMKRPGSI